MKAMLLFYGFFLLACSSSFLSEKEKDLAARVGFEEDVLLLLKNRSGKEINSLTVPDKDFIGEIEIDGISLRGHKAETEEKYLKIRDDLIQKGYYPYLFQTAQDAESMFREFSQMDDPGRIVLSLGVYKTEDKYDILSINRTDGANYGINTGDIIDKLKQWEERYMAPFYIISASATGFSLEFIQLPENITGFIEEAAAFCPDLLQSQPLDWCSPFETETAEGYIILEKKGLTEMLRSIKKIAFWWD